MGRRRAFVTTLALAMALCLVAFGGGCSSDDAGAAPASTVDGGEDGSAGPMRTTGLPATCARRAKNATKPAACNGAPELCDRTYDAVVVPMTHNAMSNADDGWSSPNQTHGIARQLADGVRGMMLDLHYYDPIVKETATGPFADLSAVDQVHLCHGPCLFGSARLLDGLCALTRFFDENPGEIVSIIFETRVRDADLDAVLRASGLAEYALTHAAGQPWPTLRAMIDSGKRAVLFVESGGGEPPYIQPAFEGNIRDTPYSFAKASEFSCRLNRGKADSPLFLVNHWLGTPLGDVALAREVNVSAVLGKRVDDCTREVGRKPTFVGVDFYEVGDLFSVVRKANGLGP